MKTFLIKFAACIAIISVALLVSCSGTPEARPEPKLGVTTGSRLKLELVPGPYYAKTVNLLVYSYTVWPQVAVWLERSDGSFVDTLYVTEVIVTGKYAAAPKVGRPEALPVWTALKTKAQSPVDSVSSATTVGSNVVYGSDLVSRLPPGIYVVKLETNRSYDWNKTYTKKNSGVNGQPSVIYAATIEIGGPAATVAFKPIGTGSVDGSDGLMRSGLAGIDTAFELFSSLTATYIPE